MLSYRFAIVSLSFALVFPACALIEPGSSGSNGIVSETRWELRRILLSGVIVDATPLERPAYLYFNESAQSESAPGRGTGHVEGFTGCNHLSGTYEFTRESGESGQARFSELAVTEIACLDRRGQVEELFLLGLVHAERNAFLDGRLRVMVAPTAPAPATVLEFERVP